MVVSIAVTVGFVAVALAVAGGAAYLGHRAELKRLAELAAVAEEMGFEFTPKGDPALVADYAGFELFGQGHSKSLTALMRGRANDLEVALFDYSFTTGSGKHRHTSRQTAVVFRFDGRLPKFSLRPENVFHRLGTLFGYQDIDFDSHPAFSKRYLLRGEDEAAVRALFTDGVLTFFEENLGLMVEGAGGRLLVYRSQARVKPDEARTFLDEAFGVLGVLRPMG
jgi:hypothetical protein